MAGGFSLWPLQRLWCLGGGFPDESRAGFVETCEVLGLGVHLERSALVSRVWDSCCSGGGGGRFRFWWDIRGEKKGDFPDSSQGFLWRAQVPKPPRSWNWHLPSQHDLAATRSQTLRTERKAKVRLEVAGLASLASLDMEIRAV